MSRLGVTLTGLIVLLAGQAGAQAPPDIFHNLTVPLRGTLEASVTRIADIAEALGGHLQSPKGASPLSAAWPDGRSLTVGLTGHGAPHPLLLQLTCGNIQRGAKAMCEDIAERYKSES